MKYRFDIVQGSDEWIEARLGIPTASEFSRIVTPKKLQLAEGSATYMHRLLAEWMMAAPLEAYDVGAHGWGKRGKDLEPEAVRYYEMERNVDTQAIGLVTTDDGMVGASPDRLVGDGGLLEIKCPSLEVHVGYMLDPESLATEYRMQTQGQLNVCKDRIWSDIMSYYPGKPAVIVQKQLDGAVQKALDQHIPAFVEAMLKCREKLTQMYSDLRRERLTDQQHVEASRAAFDQFMSGPQYRGVA